MTQENVREQIAIEAARLMLRGKEQDFSTARKRAARWLKRTGLDRDDMPSLAEIQVQLAALAGVFAFERDDATRLQMRRFAAEILDYLAEFQPMLSGPAVEGPVTRGAEILILVEAASPGAVMFQLRQRGISISDTGPQVASSNTSLSGDSLPAANQRWSLSFRHGFPGEVRNEVGNTASSTPTGERWSLQQLQSAMGAPSAVVEFAADGDADDQTLAMLQLLIEPLELVRLDPFQHPEGDALYHTLQVFELGRAERPYDEEFLLACLLHDVGLAVNRRHPVLSALDALGNLVTERTRFLIEARPVAAEYLKTGVAPKSLRKSDDFEEALSLARCDRDGRVAGAQVCTLDEAFDYIAGLHDEWDDD